MSEIKLIEVSIKIGYASYFHTIVTDEILTHFASYWNTTEPEESDRGDNISCFLVSKQETKFKTISIVQLADENQRLYDLIEPLFGYWQEDPALLPDAAKPQLKSGSYEVSYDITFESQQDPTLRFVTNVGLSGYLQLVFHVRRNAAPDPSTAIQYKASCQRARPSLPDIAYLTAEDLQLISPEAFQFFQIPGE